MDLPQRSFAVTAETEITVFHHRDGYAAQNNHVIARLSRAITDHQSLAPLFPASLFLALCPCQHNVKDRVGRLQRHADGD